MSEEFFTKLAGVTQRNADGSLRQDIIEDLEEEWQSEGAVELTLRREPDNAYDRNAVAVLDPEGRQVGYLSRQVASSVAPRMDRGEAVTAELQAVTGGSLTHNYGVNIKIAVRRSPAAVTRPEPATARTFSTQSSVSQARIRRSVAPPAEPALLPNQVGMSEGHYRLTQTAMHLVQPGAFRTGVRTGKYVSLCGRTLNDGLTAQDRAEAEPYKQAVWVDVMAEGFPKAVRWHDSGHSGTFEERHVTCEQCRSRMPDLGHELLQEYLVHGARSCIYCDGMAAFKDSALEHSLVSKARRSITDLSEPCSVRVEYHTRGRPDPDQPSGRSLDLSYRCPQCEAFIGTKVDAPRGDQMRRVRPPIRCESCQGVVKSYSIGTRWDPR